MPDPRRARVRGPGAGGRGAGQVPGRVHTLREGRRPGTHQYYGEFWWGSGMVGVLGCMKM